MIMKSKDIILRRMESQGITDADFADAGAVVGWMGCVQAQDFAQAKWAIGMRMAGAAGVAGTRPVTAAAGRARAKPVTEAGVTEAGIDRDFNEGRILRTHVLRPTWHFVLPADIGWMLRLTAPRVKMWSRPMQRQLGIDAAILARSKKIMAKALEGGVSLTRQELAVLFRKAKINTDDIRMTFLMMDAELDGLVCSGARKGKQFTYALLEERAPQRLGLDGDAAFGELARRYFMSRGPATLPDFAWWSGFTLAQAKKGLEIIRKELECAVVNGQAYWFSAARGHEAGLRAMRADKGVLLLPAFDEYMVAYKDRGEVLPAAFAKTTSYGLNPVVLVNGRVAGRWKRTLEKGKVMVAVTAFNEWSKITTGLIKKEAQRYAGFAGGEMAECRFIDRR